MTSWVLRAGLLAGPRSLTSPTVVLNGIGAVLAEWSVRLGRP
jgi:hypothetical protein